MAVGKSKRKGGKKGGKKKTVDTFARKEWYDVRAPTKIFSSSEVGKTCVNKTQGIKLASDSLKGRIFETNLADLSNNEEELHYRKLRLQVQEIRDRDCLTDFVGMDVTRDSLCALIRKWHSTIQAYVDCKTKDGFVIRLFIYSFTQKVSRRDEATCYAKSNQIRAVRAIIQSEMKALCLQFDMAALVKKLCSDQVPRDVQKKCRAIIPLQWTLIAKVKVLKKPAFDMTRLLALHSVSGNANASVAKNNKESNLLEVQAEN
eukprot:GHVH01001300.1.p1 GENE.GHVH01001300.1~~GHVH01001300.1.p1  ORF type:complete len:278 (+),score=49.78 GHVH01001300.1:56-835(+)